MDDINIPLMFTVKKN